MKNRWLYLALVGPAGIPVCRVLPRRRVWGYVPSGELQASLYRYAERAATA